MCFYSRQSKQATELEHRFNAMFEDTQVCQPIEMYNAFAHPLTPVITNKESEKIQMFNWGLIPAWAKERDVKMNTFNARIETMAEKPAFKSSLNNRCLVIADGFYEWQWLDAKGKNKQKHLITLPNDELFAFAGLWSEWHDKTNGITIKSYTIITTDADELMSEIHNSKKRMPIVLSKENENTWLSRGSLSTDNQVFLKARKV